jgi:uncharacterized lipoprotein
MSQSLRRPFVVAALLSSLGIMAGCSTITGANDIDYQSARPVDKPLEVPPDLITPSRDDRFSLPASGSASRSQFERQQGSRQQTIEHHASCPPSPVWRSAALACRQSWW